MVWRKDIIKLLIKKFGKLLKDCYKKIKENTIKTLKRVITELNKKF